MGEVIDFRPRVISLGLSAHDRAAIEAKIEELIAFLDEIDGDPDLEDDDPSGDPLDAGEAPEATPIMPMQPIYGIDQTKGPINEREGYRAWHHSVMRKDVR